MPQWVAGLDHFFAPFHLERLFLGRHKITISACGTATILANYVQEMLLDSRTLSRPYLERRGVEAIVPAISRAIATTRRRFTDSSRWNCCTGFSWTQMTLQREP